VTDTKFFVLKFVDFIFPTLSHHQYMKHATLQLSVIHNK